MATSDLSELVAIPLREKIPHFSGHLGEQRVQDWSERIAATESFSDDYRNIKHTNYFSIRNRRTTNCIIQKSLNQK